MATFGSVQRVAEVSLPSHALAAPSMKPALRHSAWVRITHWIGAVSFFALLVSGIEILISHPRFYWGETGTVLTARSFISTANSFLKKIGADRLQLRAARPEWMEPRAAL